MPIDFSRLNFVTRAAHLRLPTLVMHSDDDGYVPPTGSQALQALRPDLVTLHRFTIARHTKLWNYDPERWNDAIRSWLGSLPSPDSGTTGHN
jgi:pimeloyl-ACP methyl ester carboxylesterase